MRPTRIIRDKERIVTHGTKTGSKMKYLADNGEYYNISDIAKLQRCCDQYIHYLIRRYGIFSPKIFEPRKERKENYLGSPTLRGRRMPESIKIGTWEAAQL